MRDAHSLDLPTQTETLVSLPQALGVRTTLLEGEFAGGTIYGGRVIKFATRMTALHVNQSVEAFSNLKLRLLGRDPFHVSPQDSPDVFGYHNGV